MCLIFLPLCIYAEWQAPWGSVPTRLQYDLRDDCNGFRWVTTEKDVFAWDVYQAAAERYAVLGQDVHITNFYSSKFRLTSFSARQSNSDLLVVAKQKVSELVRSYVNYTNFNTIYFTNVVNWTLPAVIQHLDLPTNYFEYTPPRNYWGAQPSSDPPEVQSGRTTTDYGWNNLKRVLLLCKYARIGPDRFDVEEEFFTGFLRRNDTNFYSVIVSNDVFVGGGSDIPDYGYNNATNITNGVWLGPFTWASVEVTNVWRSGARGQRTVQLIEARLSKGTFKEERQAIVASRSFFESWSSQANTWSSYEDVFVDANYLYDKISLTMEGGDSYKRARRYDFEYKRPDSCKVPENFYHIMYGKRVDLERTRRETNFVDVTIFSNRVYTLDGADGSCRLCDSANYLLDGCSASYMRYPVNRILYATCNRATSHSFVGQQGNAFGQTIREFYTDDIYQTYEDYLYQQVGFRQPAVYDSGNINPFNTINRVNWELAYINTNSTQYVSDGAYDYYYTAVVTNGTVRKTLNRTTTSDHDERYIFNREIRTKDRQYVAYNGFVHIIEPDFRYQ